jgi:hypothetical protein
MLLALAITFTYWIEACNPQKAACVKADEQLAEWALKAWERAADGGLKFTRTPNREQALLRFHWEPAAGGLYGEAVPIRLGNRVGAEIHVRSGLASFGTDFAQRGSRDGLFRDTIVYLTCLHESGHAIGLGHTRAFDDIMYSFQYGGDFIEYFDRYRRQLGARLDFPKYGGMSPADTARLRELYPAQ